MSNRTYLEPCSSEFELFPEYEKVQNDDESCYRLINYDKYATSVGAKFPIKWTALEVPLLQLLQHQVLCMVLWDSPGILNGDTDASQCRAKVLHALSCSCPELLYQDCWKQKPNE